MVKYINNDTNYQARQDGEECHPHEQRDKYLDICVKCIILNTKFIILNAKSIILNAKFIIFNAKFIMFTAEYLQVEGVERLC